MMCQRSKAYELQRVNNEVFDKDYIENPIYTDHGVAGNISAATDWFSYLSRSAGPAVFITWSTYFMTSPTYLWTFSRNWIDSSNLVCGMVNNIYLFIFLQYNTKHSNTLQNNTLLTKPHTSANTINLTACYIHYLRMVSSIEAFLAKQDYTSLKPLFSVTRCKHYLYSFLVFHEIHWSGVILSTLVISTSGEQRMKYSVLYCRYQTHGIGYGDAIFLAQTI